MLSYINWAIWSFNERGGMDLWKHGFSKKWILISRIFGGALFGTIIVGYLKGPFLLGRKNNSNLGFGIYEPV